MQFFRANVICTYIQSDNLTHLQDYRSLPAQSLQPIPQTIRPTCCDDMAEFHSYENANARASVSTHDNAKAWVTDEGNTIHEIAGCCTRGRRHRTALHARVTRLRISLMQMRPLWFCLRASALGHSARSVARDPTAVNRLWKDGRVSPSWQRVWLASWRLVLDGESVE